MRLSNRAGYGFARTLRCLLHLRRGLRTPSSALLCVNGSDKIESHSLARPVTRFAIPERIGDTERSQHGKISCFHAVAHQPAKSLVNQSTERRSRRREKPIHAIFRETLSRQG